MQLRFAEIRTYCHGMTETIGIISLSPKTPEFVGTLIEGWRMESMMVFILLYLLIGIIISIWCDHRIGEHAPWKEDIVLVLAWPIAAVFAFALVYAVIRRRKERQ